MAIQYRFSVSGISMNQNIKGVKGYNFPSPSKSPSEFISIWNYRVKESKFNQHEVPVVIYGVAKGKHNPLLAT